VTRRATLMTRRAVVLAASGAAAIGGLLAACSGFGGQPAAIIGPKEMTWSCYQLGEPRQTLFGQMFQQAEQATGVKINALWESGTGYWDKRQAEAAAGSTSVDIMINQTDWVLPGGLAGLFVNHFDYMRRDKEDTSQYYKVGLDTWTWKGKLWSVPMQVGGEVMLFNKALFDARGAKYPAKDWTYDDLLEACRRLNDPANNKFAIEVGSNGIHYVMGTFMFNFGGKILNDARDKALYGDDPNAIRGAEFDVDLHIRQRFAPTAEARATVPQGKTPMELGMVAMELNGSFRHTNVRAAIGAQDLDFAPPPKGSTGIQRSSVGGDGWSNLA
jgi:multiple sugar transport system substrate-binding protein